MKPFQSLVVTFSVSVVFALSAPASAAVFFDENVTNDVIFGTGNDNGSFTVDRSNGVELGLRGKLRFDTNNMPQNTFNSNGDGTYSFDAGIAPGGFSFAPNSPTTPIWSFEWSVNTDFDNTSGFNLSDLTYQLNIDFDPGPGTNFLTFDLINPIIQPFFDHSIGDNSTTELTDSKAGDAVTYAALIANNNLAQNSWNMEFFNNFPFDTFDPELDGTYTISLLAFDGNQGLLSEVGIDIIVGTGGTDVPAPAALSLVGLGLIGLGLMRRRKMR